MATATTTLPADKFDTSTTFVRPDPLPNRAPLDKLAVLPGFNTRVKDADYSERVATVAESIASHGFFDDKPFAVVMLPNDDTIYIFDGEHRFDAAKQAGLDGVEFPDGLPIAWAKDGATVKDLTIHLAHGNNGERLNMVELAAVVRRMQGLDMDKDEIAAALGRTTRHVDNLFVLAAANQAVKKAVASGQIAGAEAVKLLRKDKTTAAAKIAEHVAAAVAKGKAKATPKTMTESTAPKGPRTKVIRFEHIVEPGTVMGDLFKAMAKQVRENAKVGDGDKLTEGLTLNIGVTVVDHEAEAAAAAKAEERAAAATERARIAEEKRVEREAAKKVKDDERAAAKKVKDDEKAAKAKATADALKAAAKGAAKAAGTKGAAAAKLTPEQAKAAAKAHLGGGKAAATTKAAPAAKAAKAPEKAAEAEKPAPGSEDAMESGIVPGSSAQEATAQDTGKPLSDESMGGL